MSLLFNTASGNGTLTVAETGSSLLSGNHYVYITGSQSGSTVSSVSFTNCFSADYDHYLVLHWDLHYTSTGTGTASRSRIELYTGSVYRTASYLEYSHITTGGTVSATDTTTSRVNANLYINSAAGAVSNGHFYVLNPYSTTIKTHIMNSLHHSHSTTQYSVGSAGDYDTAERHTGFRYQMNSTYLGTHYINIYGIKNG